MAKKKRINKKPMICMLVILLIIGIGTIYLSSRHHNDIEEYSG